MRRFTLTALLAVFALVLSSSARAADDKADKKKKKAEKPVAGTVSEVKKDGDTGSLTVKVQANKKKDPNAVATDKTFKVTSQTKFEKVEGKGKKAAAEAGMSAKFVDVAKDANVVVTAKGDTAEVVKIIAAKKKKKAAE